MRAALPLGPLAALGLALPVAGQYSSDPAVNLSVADAASDQILPKLAPTSDGGCYVSWFDGIATGFDVRLQLLDAAGVEQWAHGGVLVADRSFSSVQDYGLDLDANGNALLAFRDDSGTGVQITAQQVSSAGVLNWGPAGVQLTNTTGSLGSPKVAGTTDGDAVVAWSDNGVVQLMRLEANGSPAWAPGVQLTPPVGAYFVSDLHDSLSDSGVILSFVHQTGASFLSPKHLLAQKYNLDGVNQWGTNPVSVFDGGSLQIGSFPSFIPDGNGGAVFSWYTVTPLQCFAQRILFNGNEAFPHNGVAGSSNASGIRVSPSAAFDPATSETYLFWTEQDAFQSMSGVSGQKLSSGGTPLWGANGLTLVPLSSDGITWVRALWNGAGATVAWIASASFGNDQGLGAVVDPLGQVAVSPTLFASTPSGKTRLFAAGAPDQALLAWSDDRVDAGDVLMQNFRPDGSLGACGASVAYCTAGTSAAGCQAALSAVGAASASASSGFVVSASGVEGQKDGLFFYGQGGRQAISWGNGTSFRCVAPPVQRGGLLTGSGTLGACDGSFSQDLNARWCPTCPKPAQNPVVGVKLQLQLWYRDPQSTSNQPTSLSDALETDVCP